MRQHVSERPLEALRGPCSYSGEFYDVELPVSGPHIGAVPTLVAALGGPWTIANIGPLVDRIEVIPGASLRGGAMDLGVVATMTVDDMRAIVDQARAVNPEAPIGTVLYVAAGSSPAVDAMAEAFPEGSLFSGLAGPGNEVAETIVALAQDLGLDRVTVSGIAPDSVEEVAPHLLAP